MDGPVRLGKRKLAIEFRSDRYGVERIERAYQRLQMLASPDLGRESSPPVSNPPLPETATFAPEVHG
jgi:hypothetical protein